MKFNILKKIWLVLLISALSWTSVQAEQTDWQRRKVDWLAGPGGRIKAIRHPKTKELPVESTSGFNFFSLESAGLQTLDNNIDSPPVAGFVPQIAIAITDERSDDLDWVAQIHMSVVGDYLTDNPEEDYVIGLFDTGASFILLGNDGADRSGIFDADLLTTNIMEFGGATSSSYATVSQPLGVFIDGLAAVDPNTMMLDDSNMVGESNVAISVGSAAAPGEPGELTAVGSLMSVYFVTAIFNDNPVSITYQGSNYTSPDIRFYDLYDNSAPDYENSIPLNLIPTGASDVQYFPDLEAIFDFVYQPGSPSIIGSFLQSLFFINSVDLCNGVRRAIDKDRFMLDTGAQVSVVGTNVGSRLGLSRANPDFEVEIQDATGEITIEPGFYIDTIEIVALGDWLRFTNVPVIMLDISSPEGGYLDGIIGMNLFTEFNLVLRGGGLSGQDPPSLEFERIPAQLVGDISPQGGDGIVNFLDLAALAEAWLANPVSSNWNPQADLAPRYTPDSVIDFLDFAELMEYWLGSTTQQVH